MANRAGAIGTKAETAVVRAAAPRGFPHADRLRLKGMDDRGDVRLTTTLTAGVIAEVKGGETARSASENRVHNWLIETEREREKAEADIGILVVQRRGVGEINAHRWWCYLTMHTLRTILLTIEDHEGTLRAGGMEYAEEWPEEDLGPLDWPVRMTLEEVLHLLRVAGWGDSIEGALEPYKVRSV